MDTLDLPVVDICVRGWEMKDGVTTPVVYAAPNAPQRFLDMMSCQCGIHFNKTCTTGRCSAENLVSNALAKYCSCDGVKMEKTRTKGRVWLFWQHQYEIGDVVDQLANLVYKWRTMKTKNMTFWLTGWAYHAISGVYTRRIPRQHENR